ncbi:O-methyltransferase [Basilea psittacipulmonis]|uniref:Methyltransferase n=1 Tax=Basilea psittacipulmonis DSM 24701 TaxID=1072685 RepID=A0A077DC02_9BURK|nr:O-methyltransferase [Basilea psittacipulmonis]AIL32380.1 methyltransferase [Basilea psittacipulmonis DSM 24701]
MKTNDVDQEVCTQVEQYFEQKLLHRDRIPQRVLDYNLTQAIPRIAITATQGKFLQLLVKMIRAKRILEIGTLGGYSATWMALGLPQDGRLITLDFDPKCVDIAKESFRIASLESKVEVRQGQADALMQAMIDQKEPAFDLIFIDADKENNPTYLKLALSLSHSGTVIVADNVVRKGKIIRSDYKGNNIRGLRQFFDDIELNERLEGTALQTMVPRGWDGIGIFLVK